MAGLGFKTKYGTALGDSAKQDPTDALATLLGVDSATGPVNLDNAMGDPSLELANLRGERESELEKRTIMDPGDKRAGGLLGLLKGQIANDPVTGLAAQKRAQKDRDAYTGAVVMNEPTNPLAQDQAHNEEFELNKLVAAHPMAGVQGYNPNGSVGTGPDEGLVNGLLNYSLPLPGGNVLAREPWVSAIREAARRNPGWTPAEYANRQKVVQDFRSGPSANRIRALNQAVGHLDQLSGSIEGLGNTEGIAARPVDWMRQTFRSGSSPETTAFETPRGFLSEEMGTFFHGNPSEAAARHGLGMFSRTAAPSVNRQAVGSAAHMLMTGAQEMEARLKAGLGLPANAELPENLKELLYHPDRLQQLQTMIGGAPDAQAGNVQMVAPDGRPLSVPAGEAAQLEALGARRVR